eukprot:UN15003
MFYFLPHRRFKSFCELYFHHHGIKLWFRCTFLFCLFIGIPFLFFGRFDFWVNIRFFSQRI